MGIQNDLYAHLQTNQLNKIVNYILFETTQQYFG
jgi:hypothetical protein